MIAVTIFSQCFVQFDTKWWNLQLYFVYYFVQLFVPGTLFILFTIWITIRTICQTVTLIDITVTRIHKVMWCSFNFYSLVRRCIKTIMNIRLWYAYNLYTVFARKLKHFILFIFPVVFQCRYTRFLDKTLNNISV